MNNAVLMPLKSTLGQGVGIPWYDKLIKTTNINVDRRYEFLDCGYGYSRWRLREPLAPIEVGVENMTYKNNQKTIIIVSKS